MLAKDSHPTVAHGVGPWFLVCPIIPPGLSNNCSLRGALEVAKGNWQGSTKLRYLLVFAMAFHGKLVSLLEFCNGP
jgi:hypothetical protein